MNNLMYLKNVVTLTLDPEKCIGCGMCAEVCPHGVFAVNSRKAEIVRRDSCMECGACQMNCPPAAISVDAGVGCAVAVINTALGIQNDSCCCIIESPDSSTECKPVSKKFGCC